MNEKKFSEILTKKLRELELICAPLKTDSTPGQMDLELALDKTRELYELMNKYLEQDAEPLPDVKPHKKDAPVQEVRKAVPFIDVTKSSPPAETPKQNISEMIPEENIELETNEKEKDEEVVSDPIEPPLREPKREQGKSIIADRFQKEDKVFINENLGKNKGSKDLTSKMQSKPISDLRASIGINEKFLFIKELFKGNADYYSKSVDFLNQAGGFDNAMQYIQENFEWDKESETTKKFLELIHRKFQK
jgi:hypothetical protein